MALSLLPAHALTPKKPSKWTTDAICLCTNWTHQASHILFTQEHKNLWTTWVDVLSALETNTAKQQQNNCLLLTASELDCIWVSTKAARVPALPLFFGIHPPAPSLLRCN